MEKLQSNERMAKWPEAFHFLGLEVRAAYIGSKIPHPAFETTYTLISFGQRLTLRP
jgi:hypothetical protein